MNRFLQRGCCISDNRIRKPVASGQEWQIYLTNLNAYVLAIEATLYEKWISEFSLPEEIFLDEPINGYKVLISSGNYLISSLEQGPYPKNKRQIEAFSVAFKSARELFEKVVSNALYIEEYSLILPVSFSSTPVSEEIIFAKWLTGGINISIDSFKRVSEIMSWISEDDLKKCAEYAGFTVCTQSRAKTTDKTTNNRLGSAINQSAPDKSFTLVGRPELEQFFNDNIIHVVQHLEQYKRMGISFPGATILHGLPGCGKTYAVERLSEYLGWQKFEIDSGTIGSPYIHDTSKKISQIFDSAIKAAPSILIIDEMEAFLSKRSMTGSSGTHHAEEVAEFLRRIPEAISRGVLIFAMTNMIDAIDPAILRRGRFDYIVEVKMASAKEIAAFLKAKLSELPVDENVDIDKIAEALDAHPMSDVTFLLKEAGRFAVKYNLDNITNECFDAAINHLSKETKATEYI